MAIPRSKLVSPDITAYYHCTSRCVRGAFLCGANRETGESFQHRRSWLRDRILELSRIFSIKLGAFSVMENHFHAVLRIDTSEAENWSQQEVLTRWHKLFKGTDISKRALRGAELSAEESIILDESIARWRSRLCDISWYMRCTKEPIARRANEEEEKAGRFWEGRFHCQALLDIKALLACMSYVDLNPLRAGICQLPESDQYTSLHLRTSSDKQVHESLMQLGSPDTMSRNDPPIPLSHEDYLRLIDATARVARPGKSGVLKESIAPILERLGIKPMTWTRVATDFRRVFHAFAGTPDSLANANEKLGRVSCWGSSTSSNAFST